MTRIVNDRSEFQPERSWAEFTRQLLIVGFGVFLYFAVRGRTEGAESAALENGRRILDFEETLGLDWEMGLQAVVTSYGWLTTLSNWAYIYLHWPVIVLSLVWLHRNRRYHYLLLRNAMFVSGLIGLVIFIRFPVAPPRMLDGFIDTVTEFSTSYRIFQPPDLVNKYAAVPSLHVGWNLLVGVLVYQAVANRWVRVLAVLSPIAMSLAVVATANHYVVDGVIGISVACVGLAVGFKATPPMALGRSEVIDAGDYSQVIHDEPVNSSLEKSVDGEGVVRSPGVEKSTSLQQTDNGAREQAGVHDGAVDPGGKTQSKQKNQKFETISSRT
jgi:hypothetical protein